MSIRPFTPDEIARDEGSRESGSPAVVVTSRELVRVPASRDAILLSLTQDDAAKVFTEWMRRYQADPDAFAREFDAADAYGPAAAAYFVRVLVELARSGGLA